MSTDYSDKYLSVKQYLVPYFNDSGEIPTLIDFFSPKANFTFQDREITQEIITWCSSHKNKLARVFITDEAILLPALIAAALIPKDREVHFHGPAVTPDIAQTVFGKDIVAGCARLGRFKTWTPTDGIASGRSELAILVSSQTSPKMAIHLFEDLEQSQPNQYLFFLRNFCMTGNEESQSLFARMGVPVVYRAAGYGAIIKL